MFLLDCSTSTCIHKQNLVFTSTFVSIVIIFSHILLKTRHKEHKNGSKVTGMAKNLYRAFGKEKVKENFGNFDQVNKINLNIVSN